MTTLIRLASLGTFPLQGGRLAGGHMGPPLRPIQNGCVFLVGAGPRPARPGYAPGALVRQSQAQILNRKCSKFCRLRPPVGPEGIAPKLLLILRAGNPMPGQRDNSRNGGPGVSGPMGTKCPSAASPGDSLVTFSSLRKSLAARRRRSSCVQRIQSEPCPLIRPSVRTGAPSPWGEGLGEMAAKPPLQNK